MAEYCKTCNAPLKLSMAQWIHRCGRCAIINGKLPPTKYIAVKEVTHGTN